MDTIYLNPEQSDYFGLAYDHTTVGKCTTIHRDALERLNHPDASRYPRADLALIGQGFGQYKVISHSANHSRA